MIYSYYCAACDEIYDVIKPHTEHRREERHRCGAISQRKFTLKHITVDHTWADYNPALGTVVRNKAHLKEICREKNLVEVGNERPKTIHREMADQNAHRKSERWRQTMKDI